jgi:hypothetical protein
MAEVAKKQLLFTWRGPLGARARPTQIKINANIIKQNDK